MCTKYGVDVLFGCDILSVKKDNTRIEHIKLIGKCNYITIYAKEFIDSTTSCALCKQAGIPVIESVSEEKEYVLPFSVTMTDPKLFIQYNSTDDCFMDEQFAEKIPGSTWCGELLSLDGEKNIKCLITNMLETDRMLIQVPVRFNSQVDYSDVINQLNIKALQIFNGLKKIKGFENARMSSISPFVIEKSIRKIKCVESAVLRELGANMNDEAVIFVNNPINKKDYWLSIKGCISSELKNLLVTGTNIDIGLNEYMVTSSVGGCISSGLAVGCCAALAVIEGSELESVDSLSIRNKLYNI